MESREKTLASARTIVVKVGSAVLTTKQGLHLSVLYNLVEQLARLAASGHRVCLVSSGAVAAGLTHSLQVPLLCYNNSTQPCGTFSFLERSVFPKLGCYLKGF